MIDSCEPWTDGQITGTVSQKMSEAAFPFVVITFILSSQ